MVYSHVGYDDGNSTYLDSAKCSVRFKVRAWIEIEINVRKSSANYFSLVLHRNLQMMAARK